MLKRTNGEDENSEWSIVNVTGVLASHCIAGGETSLAGHSFFKNKEESDFFVIRKQNFISLTIR
jgi:hypothetical protein